MTKALQQIDGRKWIYSNDTRSVGERTPVTCLTGDHAILCGWVEITSHDYATDSKYFNGKRHEMAVGGSVYSGETGEYILDASPVFVRN